MTTIQQENNITLEVKTMNPIKKIYDTLYKLPIGVSMTIMTLEFAVLSMAVYIRYFI